MQYREYRKDMWCKPVGSVLFCFDFEDMIMYWLNNNKTGERVRVRSNVNPGKLGTIIKEYENRFLLLSI